MADGDAPEQTTGQTAEELAAEIAAQKRQYQNIAETLRKRDARERQREDEARQLRDELAEMKAWRERIEKTTSNEPTTALGGVITGDEPEPNPQTDTVNWLIWNRRRDERQKVLDEQRRGADQLNAFAVNAEQMAREKEPGYDDARDYLRDSYRREYEMTGELAEVALRLLNGVNQDKTGVQRAELHRRMSEKGLTELEAAKDWALDAAYEMRRADTVRAQLREGGNPALKLVELAKSRGWKQGLEWKGAGLQAGGRDARGTTHGLAEDALAELDRKKRLRAASETTADVRDGGELPIKMAITRKDLEEAQRNNPAEYKRMIKQIATDSESDPNAHHGLITR